MQAERTAARRHQVSEFGVSRASVDVVGIAMAYKEVQQGATAEEQAEAS